MYYAEKWVDGWLWTRSTPDGEWIKISAERMAARLRDALSSLIDSIDEAEAFVDLEAGCSGSGPVIEACRAVGKDVPPKLAAWLAEGADEDEEELV